MTRNGYPDTAELEKIAKWDWRDYPGFLDFLKSLWWHPDRGWGEGVDADGDAVLRISTGGWSGNESLISAWRKNRLMWFYTWLASRRGGHYEFKPATEVGDK